MANQPAGKAPSDSPALKPYRGKPAVRNFRGGNGNVGIIRSPVRAIALPDCGDSGNWDRAQRGRWATFRQRRISATPRSYRNGGAGSARGVGLGCGWDLMMQPWQYLRQESGNDFSVSSGIYLLKSLGQTFAPNLVNCLKEPCSVMKRFRCSVQMSSNH